MSDIIVYGRGRVGHSIFKLLQNKGLSPIFYDDVEGFDSDRYFQSEDLVLLSPGVKPNATGVVAARNAGCELMGEFDFCFSLCKAKIVSVTGTNGKTTICELIAHILKTNEVAYRLLGNGGVPFASQVDMVSENDIVVLESSSFQLETAKNFSPHISVLSNIAPDHLDYHQTFEKYVQAKTNNFIRQSATDFSVFNADDPVAAQLSFSSSSIRLYYSVDKESNCYYKSKSVCVNLLGKRENVHCEFLSNLPLHNLSNALCAILVCGLLGVDVESCCSAIKSFVFLPHRLQVVNSFNDVTFVDDSKATNIHATISALKCYENVPLALILGGSDKNIAFDEIFQYIGSNVRLICSVGATAEKIRNTARKYMIDVSVCGNYEKAVKMCYRRLKNIGGVVLMSNACASFDLFDGYASRGDFFAQTVEDLIRAEKN